MKESNQSIRNAFIVLNPVAGNSSVEEMRQALEEQFSGPGIAYEVYETTGEENLTEITRSACGHGADLVVAAGGDGTVSAVVNGLVNQDIPMGIIPVGTGNGLARAMNIPLDPLEAIRLLAGEHQLQPLDAMQVGDTYYILNVSAGISSRAMRETEPEEKRRLGMLAYAQTIVKDLSQPKTSRFQLRLDELQVQVEAAEVLVANGAVLKEGSYVFGSRQHYNDGELEINILTASQTSDYVRLAWDLLLNPQESTPDLHDLTARESVVLDVEGQPQPVQADGELIGHTPVEIKLVRSAIRVVVPPEEND